MFTVAAVEYEHFSALLVKQNIIFLGLISNSCLLAPYQSKLTNPKSKLSLDSSLKSKNTKIPIFSLNFQNTVFYLLFKVNRGRQKKHSLVYPNLRPNLKYFSLCH